MSKPIILAKEAIAEVEEAKAYYNSKVPSLGYQFVSDFFNTVELLAFGLKCFLRGKELMAPALPFSSNSLIKFIITKQKKIS